MGRLADRVAIVTGTSRGIGPAIAVRLAAEGARVALVARSLEPGSGPFAGSLEETAGRIRALGGECLCIAADLTDSRQRRDIVAQTLERFGGVNILVNNATWGHMQAIKDRPLESVWKEFETNFGAPLELSQLCIPSMRERGGGWIVNLSSAESGHLPPAPYEPHRQDPEFAFRVRSGLTIYGASKAALERLTSGMAAELAELNIAVNAVSPVGAVATEAALAAGVAEAGAHLEPVEAMAEAVLELCTRPQRELSGRVVYSLPLLRELGATVHTLDGTKALPGFAL